MSFCRYFMPLAVLAAMACGFSGAQAASAHQPYAGQQQRTIKALSAGDISGYLKGKGMGLAKSAELNHYPGPLHLRQLADEVKLTAEQRAAIATIEAAMKAEARRLGRIILGKEASLDALFADGRADGDEVRELTVAIGRLHGELRAVHLTAHLHVRPLLSRHQIATYDRLRGYASGQTGHSKHGKH
ncbi:MAG: hypothetical protein HOA08_21010 [Rhodospirillaceae bacterium]|nr:hypothetical protein [Rhodospirillaceae bacterium]MBT3492200.1 hypothetical protein [Rhodospirillaceae bacterium]MBT3778549.1 hypothetical protein [Rhodospirillaceae bacterium]MBT3977545.1 hypothetical protein [Rhodospirillaceae bacterium]MBT4171184.1 hypothetical protein [Rhodospirillaceae bacterium]